MKSYKIFAILMIIILIPAIIIAGDIQPKKIIYETDMCADVDDVGGLAILHAMANSGEAEILAVCFNEVHESGPSAIDAINTWYGRGDIPVGIYRGNLNSPDGSAYLDYVAEFPHDLENADTPSALDVYTQVLSEQADSSVTIVSVGFLNNLYDLLKAEPEFVAQKVEELVIMGGEYNDGFNLVRHNTVGQAEYVIRNWPSPLVISQAGSSIHTGTILKNAQPENPVREAFYRYFHKNYEGRPSWDEMAVLYGVRGLSNYFNAKTTGSCQLPNNYVWQLDSEFRFALRNKLSNPSYERIIEELMIQRPIGAHFNMSAQTGWIPFTVEFDASISVIGGNRSIEKYQWDFGDGAYGEGESVTHNFETVGTFDVRLTIIDDLGDSLTTSAQVLVSDPIFSSVDFFGDVSNYEQNQPDLWSTRLDSGDMRLFLSNEQRDPETSFPGFCFVKDTVYSDLKLSLTTRTAEDLSQNRLADYAIIFGYEDEENYNYLLMKHTTSRLVTVSNGQSISIAWTSDDGIPDEAYHQVEIELDGDQIKILLDGADYLATSSERLSKAGKIGFGSEKYAAYFDDFDVTRSENSIGISHHRNLPVQFNLYQNFPNPFNPATRIKFSLPKSENVRIEVYNTIGQKIKTLLDQHMPAGNHEVEFNGQNLFSGIYWYKIEAGDFHDVKKMILLK